MHAIQFDDSGRPAFQGDLMLTRAKAVAESAVPSKDAVVARSLNGNHHTVTGGRVYTDGPMRYFVVADGESVEFVHGRDHDTHATIRVRTEPGEVIRVQRQREMSPEGWRRVED